MSMKIKKVVVSAQKRLTPDELIEFMNHMKRQVAGEAIPSLPGLVFLSGPTPGVKIIGSQDDTFERLEVSITHEMVDRILEAWQEHLESFELDLKEILEVPAPDGIDEIIVRCDRESEPSNRIVRTAFLEEQ